MVLDDKIIHGPEALLLPNTSIGQYILDCLRENSHRTLEVVAETGEKVSNHQMLEWSVKLACILKERGVREGDRIAVSTENHPRWAIPVCSTLYLRAIIAPFSPMYTEYEIKHILNISKPRIIFVSRVTEERVSKVAKELPWAIELIQLDDKSINPSVPTFNELLKNYTKHVNIYHYPIAPIDDNSKHPAVILCSSGTTGLPKGVTLSHRNIFIFIFLGLHPDYLDVRQGDRIILFLPLHHGYAFSMMLLAIASGATAVMMRSFERDTFLNTVQKYRVTHLPLVPPIMVLLAKYPKVSEYDFSSVRELICGAAPLPKDLAEIVKNRLKIPHVRNGYGMTELSIVICLSHRTQKDVSAVGCLTPGVTGKVVDPTTGEIVERGQVGELCVKGKHLMLGYYGNQKATDETIDKEGWLHTGDLGYFDNEDQLHISGRLKELIKYKGFQVSPTEVENVLLSHPGVRDAAVVGKEDEECGELPMAFVVKQANSKVTAEEIVQFVNGKLSPQKWLRGGVRFIDAIPKNPTGKILRRELVKMSAKL